jgi:hypothetical protein
MAHLDLRKLHNNIKRELITIWVRRNDFVLDCGCGRGGDWWKWNGVGARVAAIDPDAESLKEAEKRAKEMNIKIFFLGVGDIRQAALAGPYDVVCYNFALHYIAENEETWKWSIKAIEAAVKPGGYLIGVTPEKARIEAVVDRSGYFEDTLGNQISVLSGGRRLMVRLVDGPFYADGGRDEPILDSNSLITALHDLGFEKVVWEPILAKPNGMVSDIYSKFVFRKKLQS